MHSPCRAHLVSEILIHFQLLETKAIDVPLFGKQVNDALTIEGIFLRVLCQRLHDLQTIQRELPVAVLYTQVSERCADTALFETISKMYNAIVDLTVSNRNAHNYCTTA